MLFFNPQQFFSPDETPGGTDESFSADMAVLNESSPEPAAPAPTERIPNQPELGDLSEVEEEDEDVEEAEDEDGEGDTEDSEDEEDKLSGSDSENKGKPTLAAIKKEFPGIFKKFPELKNSLFRDQEFSKYIPTPEDAAEAARKAENFDQLASSLLSGSPELLLKELSEHNPKSFKEVTGNWLPTLRSIDPQAYTAVTEPVLEELIYLAFQHGSKTGDKNLAMSARHLANFVFANGGEIPDITKKAQKEPNPAEVQLQQERQAWAETRFKEADGEIFSHVTRSLDQTIRQGLDPSGAMPERMKASIVQDVINEMNTILANDPVHAKKMQGLWRRASGDAFSRQSKEAIVSTYLSGARPLLRDLRNRIRAEYIASPGRKPAGEKLAMTPQKKKSFEGSSKRVDPRRERMTVLDPKKIDYSRTSDMDILMDKVTQRKG